MEFLAGAGLGLVGALLVTCTWAILARAERRREDVMRCPASWPRRTWQGVHFDRCILRSDHSGRHFAHFGGQGHPFDCPTVEECEEWALHPERRP